MQNNRCHRFLTFKSGKCVSHAGKRSQSRAVANIVAHCLTSASLSDAAEDLKQRSDRVHAVEKV